MAKIHAFAFDDSGGCRVILHTAMTAGNNAVGSSWKDVWLAAGKNVTSMAEGTGIGQITTVEKASVVAGDVVEVSGVIPKEVIDQGAAAVDAFADVLIAEALEHLGRQFNYYGWTNG